MAIAHLTECDSNCNLNLCALPSNTKTEKPNLGRRRYDGKRLKVCCIGEGTVENGRRDGEQNHDCSVVQFEHLAVE